MNDSSKNVSLLYRRIQTKEDLHIYIERDAKANKMDCSYFKYLISLYYGLERAHAFRYLKCLRKYEYYSNNKGFYCRVMSLYYKVKHSRLSMKYNLHIPKNTCGYGLKILHVFGGGQIINVERVGNYCCFNAGCVLGKNNTNAKPVLGDNVTMAPGSMAFGEIVIGNNVFIAPNTIVTKDIPDNSTVVGVNRII